MTLPPRSTLATRSVSTPGRGGAPASARRPAPPVPAPRAFAVTGVPGPLELRVSARSRRFSLRLDAARGVVQVVTPPGVDERLVHAFVVRHSGWIRTRLEALPPHRPFVDGALVPLLGRTLVIRHRPDSRGVRIALDEGAGRSDFGAGEWNAGSGEMVVGGEASFLARRVGDHLRAEAKRVLSARAAEKAARLGVRVRAVTVRDTRSRWGSCTADGRLSFSWRLVLAPEPVLDYVVAHEVAHLVELNHSPRFWAVVAGLTPHRQRCRDWLKLNGARLLRYG